MAGTSEPGKRKTMIRFAAAQDIALLKEVLVENPFSTGKWSVVADVLNAIDIDVDARRCRERTNLLLEYFRRDDRASLRRSGTEEMYDEKERLLQEVNDLQRDRIVSKTKQDSREQEVGLSILQATSQRLNPSKSSDTSPTDDVAVASNDHAADEEQKERPGPSKKFKRSDRPDRPDESGILTFLKSIYEGDFAIKKQELEMRQQEIDLEKQKLQLEKEKVEMDKRERECRMALEGQERMALINMLSSFIKK